MSRKRLEESIDSLAALYEAGDLLATTDPASLLEVVVEEVAYSRARQRQMNAIRDAWHTFHGDKNAEWHVMVSLVAADVTAAAHLLKLLGALKAAFPATPDAGGAK
jgi:hypothetical protein